MEAVQTLVLNSRVAEEQPRAILPTSLQLMAEGDEELFAFLLLLAGGVVT